MKRSNLLRFVCIAAGLLVMVFLLDLARQTKRQQKEISRLREELAAARANPVSREIPSASLSAQPGSVGANSIEGDQVFEDDLAKWIHRIDVLAAFLEMHPRGKIPELELLTASDWLDATKDASLETEGDFRRCLAKLRLMAREKNAANVGSALQRAIEAENGTLPADASAIGQFYEGTVRMDFAGRFTLNSTGKVQWLGSSDKGHKVVLLENGVDELWDSSIFYMADGRWGTRSYIDGTAAAVERAIKQYRNQTGRVPSSINEINELLPKDAKGSVASEAFRALTTKIN